MKFVNKVTFNPIVGKRIKDKEVSDAVQHLLIQVNTRLGMLNGVFKDVERATATTESETVLSQIITPAVTTVPSSAGGGEEIGRAHV
jgi:hypothetical protein